MTASYSFVKNKLQIFPSSLFPLKKSSCKAKTLLSAEVSLRTSSELKINIDSRKQQHLHQLLAVENLQWGIEDSSSTCHALAASPGLSPHSPATYHHCWPWSRVGRVEESLRTAHWLHQPREVGDQCLSLSPPPPAAPQPRSPAAPL